MAGRHSLLAVVLFAVILHAIAITQTILPAQDGLKFIRIAQSVSLAAVDRRRPRVRYTPPLPGLDRGGRAGGRRCSPAHGPDAWRLAAQIVAVFASIGLLLPDLWPHAGTLRSADRLPGGGTRGPVAARRRAGPRHAER